jgi:hypothetical protein
MRQMLGFRWRELAVIYLRSLVVTAAAIAPVLAGYHVWSPPSDASALQMLVTSGAGALLWFVMLRLIGHSLFDEITGLLGELLGSLRSRRVEPARP